MPRRASSAGRFARWSLRAQLDPDVQQLLLVFLLLVLEGHGADALPERPRSCLGAPKSAKGNLHEEAPKLDWLLPLGRENAPAAFVFLALHGPGVAVRGTKKFLLLAPVVRGMVANVRLERHQDLVVGGVLCLEEVVKRQAVRLSAVLLKGVVFTVLVVLRVVLAALGLEVVRVAGGRADDEVLAARLLGIVLLQGLVEHEKVGGWLLLRRSPFSLWSGVPLPRFLLGHSSSPCQ